MKKSFEINEDELKTLAKELCEFGEASGFPPDQFAIMLTMVAKYLCDAQGIDIQSERKLDA